MTMIKIEYKNIRTKNTWFKFLRPDTSSVYCLVCTYCSSDFRNVHDNPADSTYSKQMPLISVIIIKWLVKCHYQQAML